MNTKNKIKKEPIRNSGAEEYSNWIENFTAIQ
jgi:hypothetical protein